MSVNHNNALGHLTGKSIFIDDTPVMKNELFVTYLRSPYAKAKITRRDYSQLLEMEGVVGVWDYRDLKGNRWGNIAHDQPVLADEHVEYIGEPVAVIAVERRELLADVLKVDAITYEELTPVLTIDEALNQQLYLEQMQKIERGDIEQGFKDSDIVLEGDYSNGGQEHFYLESQVALAYPQDEDELMLLSSTQNPTEIQHVVAHALGLQLRQVTSTVKRMGGGFGGKETQSILTAVMVALVAFKTKRPARIVLTKDEDMELTGKRHPFKGHYKIGFNRDGKINAIDTELFSDGGAYCDISPAIMQRALLHSDNAYYFEHFRVRGISCKTNHPPNTAFRGFGAPQGVAVVEQALDAVAFHLDRDPLEIRQLNLYQGKNNTAPYGQEIENNTLAELFAKICDSSNYVQRKKEIDLHNKQQGTTLRGIGLTPIKFGIAFTARFLNQGNALVNVHLDGSVQISTGATEMGQGVNTKISQVVAETLGVAVEQCRMMITSTEKNHNTSATAASSGSDLNAMAAHLATLKIKDRLLNLAAQVFNGEKHDAHFEYSYQDGLATDHIVIENGKVINKQNQKQMELTELLSIAYMHRISLGDYAFYRTPELSYDPATGQGHPFNYYTNGIAVSEVKIDRFTGKTTVEQIDILMDLGRSINEGLDQGQIAGAFVQCMGWVTNEELVYDNTGRLLSHSPTTYKIPNIQDIPTHFHIDLIDNPYNHKNIRGSKAVGEPPFVLGLSVWSAIRYALKDYSTVPIPATAETILNILEGEDE